MVSPWRLVCCRKRLQCSQCRARGLVVDIGHVTKQRSRAVQHFFEATSDVLENVKFYWHVSSIRRQLAAGKQ